MCIILSAAILGPRAINVLWWLLASDRWSAAFNGNVILPILGILALPWTTLAFVLVTSPTGVSGLGIFVVVIGFFVDLGTYGSSAYSNKDKLGYR